ncbi:MAG: alpha/beta hydrolase [Deltaproteobacteria bacterium]|nr:alpha/beta hydrolase [Deltaproteobacteria bacterium]
MKFLFLHGGCHGAWCWAKLITALRGMGHECHAFDFPGAGTDATPRASITKDDYVKAATDYLTGHNLNDVILVGHSLAGVVMPDICTASSERIQKLVFIAGIVLEKGERAIDYIPEDRRAAYFELAAKSGDGTVMWDFELTRRIWFSDLTDADAREFFPKLTPQPFSIFLAPSTVELSLLSAPTTYILGSQDKAFPREKAAIFAGKLKGTTLEGNWGHPVMMSHPLELATLLNAELF